MWQLEPKRVLLNRSPELLIPESFPHGYGIKGAFFSLIDKKCLMPYGKLFLKNQKCLAKYLSKLFCLSGFT
jgi:hypothetical protein